MSTSVLPVPVDPALDDDAAVALSTSRHTTRWPANVDRSPSTVWESPMSAYL
jgi:hypothetical protein